MDHFAKNIQISSNLRQILKFIHLSKPKVCIAEPDLTIYEKF
jgi:hypothetical protein